MKISETLAAARDYIDKNGWCQNAFRTREGQLCMAGAVAKATGTSLIFDKETESWRLGWDAQGKNHDYFTTIDVINNYLREEGKMPNRFGGVPTFNDDPSTTKQDVLDVLDKVRIKAEEQGE